MNRLETALGAALAGALLVSGCGKQPETKPEDIRPVRVMQMQAEGAARSIELAGEVRPRYETRLAFRVGGKMLERLVEVGSTVRAGQPVARLDSRDFELAEAGAKALIAQLEAELKFAEADLKRYRDLRAKNFISEADFERRVSVFDSINARLNAARAQHSQSVNQAGYARLLADTAGVVTAIEVEAGQVVAAGQTVMRIAQSRPRGAQPDARKSLGVEMEVLVAVPESRREAFEKASAYTVSLNALPARSWKGRLRELSPVAEPATRTYAAKVTLLDADDSVELGMSARVAALTSAAEKRMELPVAALYGKGEMTQVWLVDADKDGTGRVRLQTVKTSGLAGDRVVVGSGLEQGDLVVVAGAQLLRAGQRVRIAAPLVQRAGAHAPAGAATPKTPQQ